MSDDKDTLALTVRIPPEADEMIVNGLIPFGLYGKNRATICRNLITNALATPEIQANIEKGRAMAIAKGATTTSRAKSPGRKPPAAS